MAFRTNMIGGFYFLDLAIPPTFTQQHVEPIVRPGIRGTAFRKLGVRGTPQRWISFVDTPTFEDALTLFDGYLLLKDLPPQPVIWADISLVGQRFQVLEVHPLEIKAAAQTTKGLYPPSLGLLRAEWIVWPIDHTET